jgi:hypothetical protein
MSIFPNNNVIHPHSHIACIEVLRNLRGLKDEELLLSLPSEPQYRYALELVKDSKNIVIIVSLKDCLKDLARCIQSKYEKA